MTWQISQDTMLHIMCFHDLRQNLQGIAAGCVLWLNSYLELPEESLTTACAFLGRHSLLFINRLCNLLFFKKKHKRTTSVSKLGETACHSRRVTLSVIERFMLRSLRKNSWPLRDSLQLFLSFCHAERLLHCQFFYNKGKEKAGKGHDKILNQTHQAKTHRAQNN